MKQLTGLDASFLYMETPSSYGHVNGLAIYQRPSDDFDPYTAVYERFGRMVGHLPPLRRRLVEVPLGLDHPYWIEDPHFDLDYHVRHIGLAPPGAADQLAEQVARIIGRHMDRTRPLWEVYVFEGLADGRWATLSKTHHATIDGASGVIMLKMLLDPDADTQWDLPERSWESEPIPTDAELLQKTAVSLARNPLRATRTSLRMVRDAADAAGIASVSGAATQAREALKGLAGRGDAPSDTTRVRLPPIQAPPTPWNKAITPNRRFAMRSAALDNIKALKTATGGTLNDVVMAICAGALRQYLLEHDALPDAPLQAMVPVSIRTGDEDDPWTNRVSGLVAALPTDCDDPLERVARCHEAMQAGKRQFELLPAESMVNAAQFVSPVIASSATRMVSRLKLADRMSSPINVVISNVPGPREPLYFAGAKMDAYIPVSTISDFVGLNITVHSYEDRLDFGLVSDRELVPDLWHLVDLHIDEIARLFEATGAEWVVPQSPPSMRRGGAGVDPVPPKSEAAKQATGRTPAASKKKSSPKKKSSSAKKASAKKSTPKKKAGSTA